MSDPARDLVEDFTKTEIARVVSLDWYDGPRAGFLWLSKPESGWYFRLWAEAFDSDDLDDRLYVLTPLPPGATGTVDAALAPLNPPAEAKNWVPDWQFPTENQRAAADTALNQLVQGLGEPQVVLRSADLTRIQGAWLIIS